MGGGGGGGWGSEELAGVDRKDVIVILCTDRLGKQL